MTAPKKIHLTHFLLCSKKTQGIKILLYITFENDLIYNL